MCYNVVIFGALMSPEIQKYLRIHFFKIKVGVFFTTSRNFLHGALVSFGGAATLWCHKTISYDAT